MHRFYLEAARWDHDRVIPSPEEVHHMCHVLRAKPGDGVCIFDGQGREAVAVLREVPDLGVVLDVERSASDSTRGLDIVLVQAVLKGNRMDLLVEKATELGIARLVPVVSQRSVPRFSESQAIQKRTRWERVAVSAAKQCGTNWLPLIDCPVAFEEGLQTALRSGGPVLLASLTEVTRPLATVLEQWYASPPPIVTVVIGPEGDLTPEESQLALQEGAVPVSLGQLTLRAETAAFYAVSVLAAMLRDRLSISG